MSRLTSKEAKRGLLGDRACWLHALQSMVAESVPSSHRSESLLQPQEDQTRERATMTEPVALGINAFRGDAAAGALGNGVLAAGVEEQRFTRVKHWAGFPWRAIRYCLECFPSAEVGQFRGLI